MKIVSKEVEDKLKWDQEVKFFGGRFMQAWGMGEVYKADGGEVKRIAFYDGEELIGLAQFIIVKARRGHFAFVPYGPLVRSESFSVWKEVLEILSYSAQANKCVSLRISLNHSKSCDKDCEILKRLEMKDASMHLLSEQTLVIDLEPSLEELSMNLRKKTRYEVKQCEKAGMEYKWMNDEEGYKILRVLLGETTKRQGFVSYSARFIRKQFDEFVLAGQGGIAVAYYEGKPVSAFFIVKFGFEASYFHSASLRIPKVSASHGLMWWVMQELKKEGFKRYNLWGVVGEDEQTHSWWGLSVFKRGFGGVDIMFPHLLEKSLSWKSVGLELVDKWRKWRRGY